MEANKFSDELWILTKKYGLIMTKIAILDISISVQEQLEELNNIFISVRSSGEIRQSRKRWKNELDRTEKDMSNMLNIIIEEQKRQP